MQYSAIAEKDSNSEHKNLKGGKWEEIKDGLRNEMLIHTTFGITVWSTQMWLNQRQNKSPLQNQVLC